MYYNDVDQKFHPEFYTSLHKKFKGDWDKIAEYVFAKSIIDDKDKLMEFLNNPSAKALEKDLAFKLTLGFYNLYFQKILPTAGPGQDKIDEGMKLFSASLRKMQEAKKFYPDANSTMRLTYGQVLDYVPQDGVYYNYFTTIEGIMEKEDPTNDEFIVPSKLKELYKNKDFGRYAEDGTLKVCFISNNDITGGNSGSPVINGNGELIGCAFDGNWEAMSGDIAFEQELQRTIVVDIRYILFIIDKLAGAQNIIDELNIIEASAKEAEKSVD